jgi:hypothetical protein
MSEHDTAESTPSPESTPPAAENPAGGLDLNALKSLSFGPDWSSTPSSAALVRKLGGRGVGRDGDSPRGRDGGGFGGGGGGGGFGGPPRRDRRPSRPPVAVGLAPGNPSSPPSGGSSAPEAGGEGARFAPRPFGNSRPQFREGGYGRGDRRFSPPPFEPTHEVLFYPDDAAFRALLKAIRTSCRTYELFEVAHLILQKPERFVVVIQARPRQDAPRDLIYISQPDHLPFESEEAAVSHVFDKHLDKFLTSEEIEVEPPKGNFIGVSRCGFTGELLGPPNYHRYQQLLREHHARKLSRMPFDKFTDRVELVKEPEQLAAWIEKMKKTTRYRLKTPVEGAPEFFETLDAAKQFVLSKSKDAIVRSMDTARYSGRQIELFPQGNIRNSVEALLAQQRRFPLDTANNLRGRLRRMKFNLYKKGSKGVSYICAVKRRFRDPQTVLADHVLKLITFIEQHPLIPISKLPQEFLGLPAPVAAELKSKEQSAGSGEKEVPAPVAIETAAVPTPEAVPTTLAEGEKLPTPSSELPAAVPAAKPETNYTPEQQLQLRELIINLRWLVTEGYVVEYGDGKLFASPPLPAQKAKAAGDAVASEEEIVEDAPLSPEEEAAGATDEVVTADFTEVLPSPAEPTPPPAAVEPPAEAN